ncbi:wings apart-like protein homolog [Polymixia lowei]
MTSRFGKTYSRKGGEGTSKFDEVLSNKRATLSTKWGETTYKAKVGSKRNASTKNDSVQDIRKKPRLSDESSEDPFGFDSDEESKPVSSRSAPQASSKASPAKPASAEPPQAQWPGYSLETESKSSLQGWPKTSVPSRGPAGLSSDRSQPKVLEDTARFFNSNSSTAGTVGSSSLSAEKQHSYSWYRNASESDKKPLAQTTTLKTESKTDSTYDAWDAIMGLRSPSPSQEPCNPPSTLWPSAGGITASYGLGRSPGLAQTREEKPPSPPRLQSPSESEDLGSDLDIPVEPSESEDHSKTSSSSLLRNSNCRTYRRPNKQGSGKASDSSNYTSSVFGADLPKATSGTVNKTTVSGGGRGRARDYTVLHPSCVSKCNVTIQERGVEEFNSGGAPSSGSSGAGSGGTTELGESGWQRKKNEPAVTKPRVRPTQSKSKKDSKLDLFGFEDAEAQQENRADNTAGSSSYKIKYFGFDDMSDSDDDDDDGSKERRKAKRAAKAKAASAAAMEVPVDSPPDPFERLESQESLERLGVKDSQKTTQRSQLVSSARSDVLEFSEDSLRVVAEAPRRPPQGKPAEKNPDTHRRIFSGPKKVRTGHLAMETLLSLTSKRAGDWFKEELRLLGGLDHIVDKVKECVDNLSQEDDKEELVSSLWGAERCLRVLESVTVHNPENQSYLIAYKDSSLIISSAKALRRCEEMIQRYSREVNIARCSDGTALPFCSNSNVGKAVEDCMRAIIGVLLNLTHDNEWGSTKTGEQEDLIETALNCVLRVPQYLPQEQRFDIRVLGLGLLINLVEYSARNKHCLMEMEMEGDQGPCDSTVLLTQQHQELTSTGPLSAIAALVQLFLQRERAAILAEAQTDDLIKEAPKPALDQSGEWQETGGEIQWVANDNNIEKQDDAKKKKEEEDEELDLNKALQHAGKHMEDSIVASYTALLLGCLCQGSPMNVTTVRENLPKGDFSIMTEMLKKFLNFMNLTCDVGTTGQKSISRVIDYLEHC